MPQLNVKEENKSNVKHGTRMLLVFGRIDVNKHEIEIKMLKRRKRRDLYPGRRNRTAVILTVAKGRGQRRA